MSDRTIAKIHSEYSNLCAKAGHAQYQISVNKKELELINEQLRDLNLEAAAVNASEAKAASDLLTKTKSPDAASAAANEAEAVVQEVKAEDASPVEAQ